MVEHAFIAYLSFVQTGLGRLVIAALCVVTLGGMVLWARRAAWWQRWPILIAACVLTVLVAAIYALAVATGAWGGAYLTHTPPVVQTALLIPISLVGWVLWLAGYGWLVAHSRHPVLIYSLLALLLIPLVVVADQANVGGGVIVVAEDGDMWKDAVVGIGLMLIPVLVFEGIRRTLQTEALP
jgi:hypothetical protein